MILVARNIRYRYMRIFARVPRGVHQMTVGLSKCVIFIVCYWLYVVKLYTGYAGYTL